HAGWGGTVGFTVVAQLAAIAVAAHWWSRATVAAQGADGPRVDARSQPSATGGVSLAWSTGSRGRAGWLPGCRRGARSTRWKHGGIPPQESLLAVDQVLDQRARRLAIVRGNDRVIAAVERPLHGALVRWVAAVAIEVGLRSVD